MRTIIFVVAAAIASASCVPSQVSATVSSDPYLDDPYLAYVRPGVYAVANWRYPVFYSNNAYWRYHDGLWYRSRYYTGGWYRARPPISVLRIDRPTRFRNWQPRTHVDIREERAFRDRSRFDHRTLRDGRRIIVPRETWRSDRRFDRRFDRRPGLRGDRPRVIERRR